MIWHKLIDFYSEIKKNKEFNQFIHCDSKTLKTSLLDLKKLLEQNPNRDDFKEYFLTYFPDSAEQDLLSLKLMNNKENLNILFKHLSISSFLFYKNYLQDFLSWRQITAIFFSSSLLSSHHLPLFFSNLADIYKIAQQSHKGFPFYFATLAFSMLTPLLLVLNIGIHLPIKLLIPILVFLSDIIKSTFQLFKNLYHLTEAKSSLLPAAKLVAHAVLNLSIYIEAKLFLGVLNGFSNYFIGHDVLHAPQGTKDNFDRRLI
jgi:hypothetical protein